VKELQFNIAELRAYLSYCPETGIIRWKLSDKVPDACRMRLETWNRRFAGQPAFNKPNSKGYKCGWLWTTSMLAHRVAWALHYGEWPSDQIDHVNGDKTDNRLENLRIVTAQGNAKNRSLRSDNTSGHVGVYWVRETKKWSAQIKVDGKQKTIATFESLEDAVKARKAAEDLNGYHANHGRRLVS
jgi:hypothetical protein